jgi:UDPglucose 6-dehydrogenase
MTLLTVLPRFRTNNPKGLGATLTIPLVIGLLDMGAKVRAHDPVGMEQARRELPDVEYCGDPYECAHGADVMVIVTEWAQFRALDLTRLKREMAGSIVIDLRNIYNPQEMEVCGFIYEGIGRGAKSAL